MVRFLVSTTDEMHDLLRWHARKRGDTLNSLIRAILLDWLDQHPENPVNPADGEAYIQGR